MTETEKIDGIRRRFARSGYAPDPDQAAFDVGTLLAAYERLTAEAASRPPT